VHLFQLQLPERTPFRIVHLGDSYSAGNGARNEEGDKDFHSVKGCYRSPSNWGSRFAESLADVFAVTYINRACSGGVLADITDERELGSVFNVIGGCPEPDFPDEEILRDEGAVTCTRYLIPQIGAVDNSVDLVVMTIGGNDAGFATIIEQCFALGFRDPEECEAAVDFANGVLDTFQERLVETFASIRARLKPEARVALVSYPHLLLDVPYVLGSGDDRYDAGTAIRALNDRANQVQQSAVDAANAAAGEDYIVYFDRTKGVFDTHEPDPSAGSRNPDRWINEFFEGDTAEWYHPNALGHENWGSELSVFETFGAVGGSFEAGANIDLVFVVDTTGSMGNEIDEVRNNLSDLVNQLSEATSSYRVAVVSYRDFPERAGAGNYPSRVDQTFTSSLPDIQAAIDGLEADGGGDFPETVFSGINAAIDLPWRAGVTKIAVVIGDAPPLVSGGAEPNSGLTATQIVAKSIAVDPVEVIAVDVGGLVDSNLQTIVTGTGGSTVTGTGGLTAVLSDIIDATSRQPFAWFGTAVSGKVGTPIVFDAQGSFDPRGNPITLYEWDFDGNGVFDLSSMDPTVSHVYDEPFEGFVIVRVTSLGGTALASARTVINELGFVSQGDEEPCELDEDGFSIFVDDVKGIFLNCQATSLPTQDKPGVFEVSSLDALLADLESRTAGLRPPAFGNMVDVLGEQVGAENYRGACDTLEGLRGLTNAQTGKKITDEDATAILSIVESVGDILECSNI